MRGNKNYMYRHINLRFCVLMISFIIFSNIKSPAQTNEYMVKAVALEKLSMFITWPPVTIKSDISNEFVITVLGQNPFGDLLEEVYKDKKIKEKKVVVNNIGSIAELKKCDILFISKMKLNDLKKVLSYVDKSPVLTISDTDGFAEAGCFINLYEFENKLRFEINQKSMQSMGFKIDYRLLRVSKVLNPVIE